MLVPLAFISPAVAGSSLSQEAAPSAGSDIAEIATTQSVVQPDAASELGAATSSADATAAREALYARRDAMALEANEAAGAANAPSAAAASETLPPETVEAPLTETASIISNRENSVATSVSSTLAEPAAAADGQDVIYGGNTYLSRSTNAGNTWVQEALPGGSAAAPNVCCDSDVVYHPGTDTTVNLVLYLNATGSNGEVRMWVRQGSQASADCSYTNTGGGANDVPDYPHIAVSDNFLYLSTNNIDSVTGWTGATTTRYDMSDMSTCVGVATNTFNHVGAVGQRIHTPAEGATNVMYMGSLDNTTTFRLFAWPESTTVVSQTTRTITASAFANPDCRGGTGNNDFIERTTSWSIAGFRMRGATGGNKVTFLWPSSAVGGATQAHLRGITMSTLGSVGIGPGIVAQPVVFNNGRCFSYPALSANPWGDLALSLAHGGQSGGGGDAAQGAILVDDSSSAGVFFPTYFTTAVGTHNRADDRFGDYFTVRQSSRCRNTWVATNFALNGGNTLSSHVNARYIEFQSTDDLACPAVSAK